MMQMCMAQSLSQTQKQRIYLNHSQKQELKLVQRQDLAHPPFRGEVISGFEGMLKADEILKEKNSVGLLIGSLSAGVWNQKRTKEELSKHYDVDVLIIDEDSGLDGSFEGSIDWFIPRTDFIKGFDDLGDVTERVTWYENANNHVVPVGVHYSSFCNLNPGLYIPGRDFVVGGYVSAYLQKAGLGGINNYLDSEIIDKLRKKVESRGVGKSITKFVLDQFGDNVLDEKYAICIKNGKIYTDFSKVEAFRLKSFNHVIWKELNK